MAGTIKPAGRWALIGLAVVALFFGARWFINRPKKVGESQNLGKVSVPDVEDASLQGTAAVKLPLPGTSISGTGVKVVWNEMAWNSQTSINYANGGAQTTKGSLIEKAGLNIQIVRQDNCTQSCTDMIKYIKDYASGSTKDGFFITFMGSGIPGYFRGIYEATKSLGPEYAPICFLITGKSYGEDQVMGDIRFKENPQNLKGAVCRGVRLDGDLDLLIKFASDNGVPVNSNDKLYYADAVNLSYSDTYLSAVNDYNNNLKETRKLVVNGKTSKDTSVGYDMVATWTPGDVNVMNGRGGVTIISTRKYASVMPNVTITCRKFLNDNRTAMENLVGALAQAGDQIRSYDDVLQYACNLNAKIWNEQTGKYWYDYYKGIQRNANVHLGGSMVYNLADMSKMLGLNGTPDIYKEIYNTFGKLQSRLYPDKENGLPDFVDYSKVFDKSITQSVVSNHPELLEGKPLEANYEGSITTTVASKDVHINFETGSATILPSSYEVLNDIYSSAITAEGLKIGVYGHTDNVGNPESNRQLSLRRAQAVRDWLIKKGIPEKRIETEGFGEEQPIGDNLTDAGRAANRRVQIVLGSN